MQETEKIWMNGELVAWADAKVHVLSHALHYGSGVFEGIRAYATDRGPAVFRLMDHLRRLERSSEVYFMQLPYSIEELRQATHEVIAANGLETCYVRPLAFRGYGEMGINPLNCPVEVDHRRVAVGRLPRRGGARARRARDDVVLAPHRPEHAAGDGQGQRPVPQLAARQDGGHALRLRRGDPAQRAGLPRRRLGRERVHGAGRRAHDAAHDRVLPARHHARHRDPDRPRHGLRRARDRRRAQRPLPRRRGLLHGHGRRDHADPLDRRARDRRGADHEAHPDRVLRDHDGPLRALARVPRLPRRDAPPRRERPGGAPDPALAARHRAAGGGVRAGRAALRHPRARPVRAQLREGVRGLLRQRARRHGLERHGRPAPAGARGRHRCGRRGHHGADLVRRLGQRDALRARDARLRRRGSRHVRARPGGRRGGRSRRARAGSCPCTCSATRATWRRSARSPRSTRS